MMKELGLLHNKRVLVWEFIGIALLICIIFVLMSYFHDMQISNRTANNGAKLIKTPIGTLEYYSYGTGKPILISHGAGGGFDQGILISKILGPGYRFIIPSRFGYLHSKASQPVTTRLQAEAYSYILKDAGVSKATVVAFSAGGKSGLSFASHYPDMCENLVMISAISVPIENSKDDKFKTIAFNFLFKSDFVYWSVMNMFRTQILELYGLSKEDQQRLTVQDKKMVDDLLYTTMPASLREQGVVNDQKIAIPTTREVEAIKVPTLIFHVKQDPLISFRNAEYTNLHISGSKLIALNKGGHFVMGHHREIADEVKAFLFKTDKQ